MRQRVNMVWGSMECLKSEMGIFWSLIHRCDITNLDT